ncbi:dephospho-CoA kinase [candidate division KSB1 bacterium]|nr:dephospho-CoA kinase [candidate division KSB1 bacterium]
MKSVENSCPVIAITGGIGSGKSTASKFFQEQGAFIINADYIAKNILWKNEAVHQKVIDEFGSEICGIDGKISKKLLSKKIFQSRETIRKINAVIHPPVRKEIRETVSRVKLSGKYTMIAVESALVFESGIERDFDVVVTVAADDELRIKRAVNQNIVSPESVLQRMKLQDSQEDNIKKSDYVIYNNKTISALRKESLKIIENILGHNFVQ